MKLRNTLATAAALASITGGAAVSGHTSGATSWLDAVIAPAVAGDDYGRRPRHMRRRMPPAASYDSPLDDMQRMMEYMRRQEAMLTRKMQQLQQEMDREMARQEDGRHSLHMQQNLSIPAVKIDEDENNYLVTVNMPDADKPSIKLKLEGSVLSIGASKKMQKTKKGDGVYVSESASSSVIRSITLPGPVQQNNMRADYRDGKLLVVIPKAKNSS